MKALQVGLFVLFFTALALAQPSDKPETTLLRLHQTMQARAQVWLETRPWPDGYEEFMRSTAEAYRPYASAKAQTQMSEAGEAPGPADTDPSENPGGEDSSEQDEMMRATVGSTLKILDVTINGDRAVVKASLGMTVEGQSNSFQETFTLVKENGRWLATPETLSYFAL